MIHIVLYEPLIPQNTGNIMRTCVALGMRLHLIEPLGFKLDEAKLKRSALDYYEYLDYCVYPNYQVFKNQNQGKYYFLTRYGKKNYAEIDFKKETDDIYLIFGKETTGIDRYLLHDHIEDCFRIPTTDKVRSLNLSNSVAIVAYEAHRQLNFEGLIMHEPESLKGEDYLDQFVGGFHEKNK